LLLSILLPSLQTARKSANQVKCASNLRQIMIGQLLYAEDNKGMFTQIYDNPKGTTGLGSVNTWPKKMQGYVVGTGGSIEIVSGKYDNVFFCPQRRPWEKNLASEVRPAYALNGYMRVHNPGDPPAVKPEWYQWNYKRDRVRNASQILVVGDILDEANWDYMRPTDFGFHSTRDDVVNTGGNPPGFRHGKGSGVKDSRGNPAGLANMAFADGHVEALTHDDLKIKNPGGDSRWKWWRNQ
jgi:prepilin-type processing-associated H-X9-DG protein